MVSCPSRAKVNVLDRAVLDEAHGVGLRYFSLKTSLEKHTVLGIQQTGAGSL